MGHAHNAAMGMGAGMLLVAAAGNGLASSLINAQTTARERRYEAAHDDAIADAIQHASTMEQFARISIARVAELEAQVRSLTAACTQRQGCIDRMRARMS